MSAKALRTTGTIRSLAEMCLRAQVVGAEVPILIRSREESAEKKLNAIALGVLYGSR